MKNNKIAPYFCTVLVCLILLESFAAGFYALADESTRPILILESYTLSGNISGGEDFVLEYTLKNTSRTATVDNILFTIQPSGGIFYPTEGQGNQYYITSIYSMDTHTGEAYLSVNPSVADGVYNLEYTLSYQGGADSLLTNSGFVSLKISSMAIEILDISLPEQCAQGRPTFFSVRYTNNLAKELRDVRVILDGDIEDGAEILIGTVRPGATSLAEGYVTFLSIGEQSLNCYLTYVSDDGTLVSFKPHTQKTVVAGVLSIDQDDNNNHPNEPKSVNNIVMILQNNAILVIISAVGIYLIAILISILKKRRK